MLWLLLFLSAHAARIETTTTSGRAALARKQTGESWKRYDRACIQRGETRVGCGYAIAVHAHGIILEWDPGVTGVQAGDEARPIGVTQPMVPGADPKTPLSELHPLYASLEQWSEKSLAEPERGAGPVALTAGVQLVSATVGVHSGVAPRSTVGLNVSLAKVSHEGFESTLTGGTLVFSHYLSELWSGPYAHVGLGIHSASTRYLRHSGTQTGLSAQAAAGWRLRFGALNAGISAGGQFLNIEPADAVAYRLRKVSPFAQIEIAYALTP